MKSFVQSIYRSHRGFSLSLNESIFSSLSISYSFSNSTSFSIFISIIEIKISEDHLLRIETLSVYLVFLLAPNRERTSWKVNFLSAFYQDQFSFSQIIAWWISILCWQYTTYKIYCQSLNLLYIDPYVFILWIYHIHKLIWWAFPFLFFRIFEINFSILNFDFLRFDIEILICCIIHIMSQSINFFSESHSALIFSAFSEDEVFSSSKRFEFFDFFEIFDRAIFFSLNSIYSMILNYLIENLSRICFIALAHFSEFLISKDSNHRGKRCRVFSVSEFQATSDKSDLRLVIDEIVKSRCVCPCR